MHVCITWVELVPKLCGLQEPVELGMVRTGAETIQHTRPSHHQ